MEIKPAPTASECSPKQRKQFNETMNRATLRRLDEAANGQPAFFAPPMTPWVEDYYYGRKLR